MKTPYTPAAIAHIRQHAPTVPAPDIAAALGWDMGTLRRRAAIHGIELTNCNPTMAKPKPVIVPKKPIKVPVPIAAPLDPALQLLIDCLPTRRGQIVAELARLDDGAYISAKNLAPLLGHGVTRECTYENLVSIAKHLRSTGSRWQLDAKRHRHGGYRLIDTRANA